MYNIKQITFDQGRYNITFDSGERVEVGAIVSEGKQRRDDNHFDHTIQYSDGTVKKAVLSTRTATLPDYSKLD